MRSLAQPGVVSVVVAPLEGGPRMLQAAIASVTRQSYGHVQLVVATPQQDDEMWRVLQRHAHELIHVPCPSLAGQLLPHGARAYEAFNAGLAQASGEVVVFLGERECLATSSVLSAVAQVFADPCVDAVYGDLLYVSANAPGTPWKRWRAPPLSRAALGRGWLTPLAALFVRRVWFDRVGRFDARLGTAADFDKVGQLFRQPGFRAVQLQETCSLRVVEHASTPLNG